MEPMPAKDTDWRALREVGAAKRSLMTLLWVGGWKWFVRSKGLEVVGRDVWSVGRRDMWSGWMDEMDWWIGWFSGMDKMYWWIGWFGGMDEMYWWIGWFSGMDTNYWWIGGSGWMDGDCVCVKTC